MLERKALRAFESGDFRRAAHFFELHLKHDPRHTSAWRLLGTCLHQLGQRETAVQAFAQALSIEPVQTLVHLAIATILSELGRHAEALDSCQQALATAPSDPHAHTCTAIVLEYLGRPQQAVRHYDLALQHDPNWIDAIKNRGSLLLSEGRLQEALENNLRFSETFPLRADAWFNLGESHVARHQFEKAAAAYCRARHLAPEQGRALLQEAYALCRLEQFDTAQLLLDEAWQRFPDLVLADRKRIFPNAPQLESPLCAKTIYVCSQFERLEQCDWHEHEHFCQTFSEILADPECPNDFPLGFRALAMGVPLQQQLNLARRIASSFSIGQKALTSNNRQIHLRIGYLSADFRNHAVGQLMHKIFASHDSSRFEAFAYSIGPEVDDPLRDEIRHAAACFTNLSPLSDDAAAERIARDHIDVLIDLAGYTDHARPGIFARRPAPIQIAWLGYLATTGADWMDYFVLDHITAPPYLDEYCSEAIIRLPHSMFFCSYANEQLPTVSRHDAGLPETGPILAAFHNAFKIDPEVFSIWMRLLDRYPSAILWLLAGTPEMERNLKREAEARGITPERLIFAPRMAHQQHLARFSHADILLDTPQCNGGATVCDALIAGVPVLTCSGAGIAKMMASSLEFAAGFAQGVTDNITDYEQRAHEWLSTPGRLHSLREELESARARAPFFQLNDWIASFELALEVVWRRHALGLPPQAFAIAP